MLQNYPKNNNPSWSLLFQSYTFSVIIKTGEIEINEIKINKIFPDNPRAYTAAEIKRHIWKETISFERHWYSTICLQIFCKNFNVAKISGSQIFWQKIFPKLDFDQIHQKYRNSAYFDFLSKPKIVMFLTKLVIFGIISVIFMAKLVIILTK